MLRCPGCRYEIEALLADRLECTCPECGAAWTRERIQRLSDRAKAAWVVWLAMLVTSTILLGSIASSIGRGGLPGVPRHSRFPGTSYQVGEVVALSAPALWGVILLVATLICSRWLSKAGRGSQAIAMRAIGLALILLGGSAWALFTLFAIGMSRIPPP